jgi:serine/threonine protein kinase
MYDEKFRLSKHCHLLETSRIKKKNLPDAPEVNELLEGKLFVLEDHFNWHLINPTIKAFLEAFKDGASLNEVIHLFAEKADCKMDEIQEALVPFFKSMKKKGFLEILSPQNNNSKRSKPLLQKGFLLNNLKIVKRIFQKKNLEIYLAETIGSKHQAAIKILNIQNEGRPKKTEKKKRAFAQEFHLMKEMAPHPNVCQCYEYIAQDGFYYGVLEFINGTGLRGFIKKQQPNISERLRLVKQVVSSMAHVHQHKILHGDIHLSNFLVANDSRKIKLIDFNMSNRETPIPGEVIREGGVFQYIPPEKVDARAFQLVNSRSDYRSEVFQIGVIIYYIFYRKMPFDDFTWKSLAHRILNDKIKFTTHTLEGELIPEFAIRILKKCLKKNPSRRFRSAITLFKSWNKSMVVQAISL